VHEVPARDEKESFERWVQRVGNPLNGLHDVVFQMPFIHEGIRGVADFLVKAEHPTDGTFTHEPVDAKLARRAAGTAAALD
jgi:hypothetical protein